MKQHKSKHKSLKHLRWILTIIICTVIISGVFSIVSNLLLRHANLLWALVILFGIMLIGIIFDIIGVAVTAADAKPFHSMASHKVIGAKEALSLINHAERVGSFCNDVIGDVCGIISGTASASIVVMLSVSASSDLSTILEILGAALISGLTVGGKAIGKIFAMNRTTEIVHLTAKIICYLSHPSALFRKRDDRRHNS